MDSWLAWHNLLFLLPIVVGALLAVGAVLGGTDGAGDADGDFDAEADTHADADSDHDHDVAGHPSLITLLGLGRVPLTILLMLWLLLFGALGVSLKAALGFSSPSVSTAIAAVVSVPVTLVVTGFVARGLSRLMPSTETYAATKAGLIGLSGTAELEVNGEWGMANVRDEGGALHKLRCRTYGGVVEKGTEVLITDYDPDADFFIVEESPLSRAEGKERVWF